MKLRQISSIKFPEPKLYNQIVRLHLPSGGINVHTWKWCTQYKYLLSKGLVYDESHLDQDTQTDMFFDHYVNHQTYCIVDDKDYVYGWAIVLIGTFENNPSKKFGAIQFFTRPQARGKGIAKKLFIKCLDYLEKNNVRGIFYYASMQNRNFFHKMRSLIPKPLKLMNIYKELNSIKWPKRKRRAV